MNALSLLSPSVDRPPVLTFAPLAWLKLQFFCQVGTTEIGGFGISAARDLLYVRDFITVLQHVTPVTVCFDDAAVADHFDACVDRGINPSRCGRIWLHTHPGDSVTPSGTDEETFARVFGACDWSVMFILGRTGHTYAHLAFSAGPGGQILLPVQVDWSAWPEALLEKEYSLEAVVAGWRQEFADNIRVMPDLPTPLAGLGVAALFNLADWRDWEPWWGHELETLEILDAEDNNHESVCANPVVEPRSAPTCVDSTGATR